MKEPVLVVMAAGMGSRYGGPKQIDPVGDNGEIIIDFSLYDAVKAGFKKVVFLIKKSIEADFKEIIGDRMSKIIEVKYAYQEVDELPPGYRVPQGRGKPWGTAHAVLCCREVIDAPFAVINADDYYGKDAFRLIYDYLLHSRDDELYRYAMVGYTLENTLTDHGHVARGVCVATPDGFLQDIHERTHIEKRGDAAQYTEDGGSSWITVPRGSTVSMNLWGFSESILEEIAARFPAFLDNALKNNPLKAEFFLPTVVDELLKSEKASVKVLQSPDRWYGVTYREDKPVVVEAIRRMRKQGIYPDKLWEGNT
ncbi:nucleotidyltransferase family protein [Caproiciproducens faecalis]|uniref:Nucleotidyltransferase n=1 Tax=Caproiciproducens faecalis TaxID=2820301 RepID=A0ABS7DQ09_9FIRM|nr:sugar phosphate nucleotidyltransferase [Caproiciproducens faecalis]MBW7572641.1 nucleotidyltransferase [Caproiciproducens faecalis]